MANKGTTGERSPVMEKLENQEKASMRKASALGILHPEDTLQLYPSVRASLFLAWLSKDSS